MDSSATASSGVESITDKLEKLKNLSHLTSPTTQSSRFFSLPRELRDLIFAQVFEPQDNVDIEPMSTLTRPEDLLKDLLTVNRQFHDEAIASLQRTKWIKINWWRRQYWSSEVKAIPKLLRLPRAVTPALKIDIIEVENIPRREKWRANRNIRGNFLEPCREVWTVNEEGLKQFVRCLWQLNTKPQFDEAKITLDFHPQDSSTQLRISRILFHFPPFKEQSITGVLDKKLQWKLYRVFELPRHDKRRICQALIIDGFISKGDAAYVRGDFVLAIHYYANLTEFMTGIHRHWNSGEAQRRILEGIFKFCKASVRTGRPILAINHADWVVKRLTDIRSSSKHPEVWRLSKLQLAKLDLCMARAQFNGEANASEGISKFLEAKEVLDSAGQPPQPTRSKDIRDCVRFAYEIADECEEWTKLITDRYSGLSLEDEEDDAVSEVVSESTSSDSQYSSSDDGWIN
ncbi:hypothetical protein MMC17_003424 [Xylographa soralifera]|nr:hypothetical protein [Xylographa soralifera]